MTLLELVKLASDKQNFTELKHYVEFCKAFWDFARDAGNIQAEIVARNETQYRFLQFKEEGAYNVTRPLNYNLLYSGKKAGQQVGQFLKVLDAVSKMDTSANREVVNRAVYTIQQAIGCSLDALPAGSSNTARKINGDLFERLVRLILVCVGIDCTSGVVNVPVKIKGEVEFSMSYQHDLVIRSGELVKIIGSVKTSAT